MESAPRYTKASLLKRQKDWARSVGMTADHRGYLHEYARNLWRPLSGSAQAAFENGSGSELRDGKTRPAKMRALHSSSALAVNFFDYWSARDPAPLYEALGVKGTSEPPRFEVQFPTGLDGEPPNLDIAIRLASGKTYAIESKFCEWLTRKSPTKPAFKTKYFEPIPDLWNRVGLAACQALADDMRKGRASFLYLDAPQLLKHALGLATNLRRDFSLSYLYYEWPARASQIHKSEIQSFSARVGDELDFRPGTYQELFLKLKRSCRSLHEDYLGYLDRRYFAAL